MIDEGSQVSDQRGKRPDVDALGTLLEESHLAEPDDLPRLVRAQALAAGALDLSLYLADYGQTVLMPLTARGEPDAPSLEIDRTLAGRCYRHTEVLEATAGQGRLLWVPLLDGTERIGVMRVTLAPDVSSDAGSWRRYASLAAELVVAKAAYGDGIAVTRRQRPLELRAELQRSLLPPQTLATPRVVISGMLEPAYEVAGDVFDYAVNGDIAHVAIFDAVGHSLRASLIASVAVASYRNSRRGGAGLETTLTAMNEAVSAEFDEESFVTALLAELHLSSGQVRSITAGHAAPLLVRQGRVMGVAAHEPTLPVGLGPDPAALIEQSLEPGDRLVLFTDGIVEARSEEGEFFGDRRLVDLLAREAAAGHSAPETVRRLVRAVIDHQGGNLQDDATLLLLEWLGRGRDQDVDVMRLV